MVVGIIWAILAGAMCAGVVGVFGWAIPSMRQAGQPIPVSVFILGAVQIAVVFGAAYASYHSSNDFLAPLTALLLGTVFGARLVIVLKKRLPQI